MTRAVFAMLLAILTPAVWAAQMCAAPGKDGSATLSGIVNDYFPGTANTVLKAGSTQLTLGTARTSAGGKSVAAGDLLLVIQMQDASINKSNSSAYGDGSGSGQGTTSVGNTGLYEFVTVTEVTGSGATTQVKFAPALTNTYTNAAAVADVSGQKTYQIVRVPQYTTATANGVYAPAWDGSTGGVVSMDVRDGLTLAAGTVENISNRAIFVGGKGFRGALGTAASSNGDKTRWAGNDTTPPGDGGKGEGIAGTPKRLVTKDLWAEKATSAATSGNLSSVVGSVEGYPLGSRGRGAPGNAGGGGNDGYQAGGNSNQNNSGGGGGGNYAPGGVGGRPWDFPLEDTAGRGGAGYMGTVAFSRVFLGGGGGAGGTNNSTGDTGTYSNNGVSCGAGALCSSGAAGGGVVILRAGSVSGTGVIDVRGANGYNVQQDAAGGGGAGGSVVIYSADGGSATVDASGGDGGNAWAGNTGGGSGQRHGPGGGGGGGFVAYAPTNFVLTATIKGGTPGYTTNGTTDNYGAEGNIGGIAAFQPPTVPGILPGAECHPDLHLSKTNTGTTLVSGTPTTYVLTATNQGMQDTTGTITVVDVLPAGMSVPDGYVATSGAQGTNWSCNAASNVLTCTSATTIAGNGGSSAFGVSVNVSAVSGTGTVNKARIGGGGDPYKPTPDGGTASACTGNSMAAGCAVDADTVVAPLLSLTKTDGIDNLRAGAATTYHLTVANQGAVATSGTITVVDQLPSGTSFAGSSNTFNSSDGSFSCTYASASLSVTCTRTTSLGVNQSSVIDIPVTILATAPGAVINLAQVGGGGDPTKPTAPTLTSVAQCSSTVASDITNGCASDVNTVKHVTLTLTKDDGRVYVNSGGTTTYAFRITNWGDEASVGQISFRDVLPAKMTWPTTLTKTGANAGDWTCTRNSNTDVSCTSSTVIPAGGTSEFALLVNAESTMNAGEQFMNKARIGGGGDALLLTSMPTATDVTQCTNDQLPYAGCAVDLDTAQSSAQIRLSKTHADPQVVSVGSNVTFTLTVSNTGGSKAAYNTVQVIDVVPAGFSNVAATTNQDIFKCSVSGNVVTCTNDRYSNSNGDLAAKTSATITVTATVAAGATNPLLNTAQVGTSSTSTDPQNGSYPSTTTAAACTGNGVPYVGCAVDSVPLSADLQITKSQVKGTGTGFVSTPLTVSNGDVVRFAITVTNAGAADVSGASFSDVIPANFSSPSIISTTSSGTATGCSTANITLDGNKLAGTLTKLTANSSCTVVVQVTASTNGVGVINTATVTVPTGIVDSNPGNNTSSVSTTIQQPTITASKTVSASPLVVGATGQTYSLIINVAKGPTTAPITVADTLPTGITLSGTPTMAPNAALLTGCSGAGSISLGASCQIAAGLADGSYTITIPVSVAANAVAGGGTNKINLGGGGDPACTAAGENDACDPSTPVTKVGRVVDLRITKTAMPDGTYVPNTSLNYSIVVRNEGPSDATGVSVTDTVPDKVVVSNWSCTPLANCGTTATGTTNNVALTNVSLAKGESLTITVTGKAAENATVDIVNTATVTPPTASDVSCAGTCVLSSTTTNTNSGKPALGVEKSSQPQAFAVGGVGTYGITVTNTGTSSTNGVITVTDPMPSGVSIRLPVASNVSGSGWDCSTSTASQLVCTSSAVLLPKGIAPVILANVQVSASFAGSSVKNDVTAAGGGADCSAAGACTTSVTTPVNAPALTVEKALQGTLKEGQLASYLITVTNSGQAATLAGTVTDVVPASLTINSYPATCSASGQVLTCEVPADLGNGAHVTYTIGVTPVVGSAGSSVANTAKANPDTGDASCSTATGCSGTTNNTVLAPELAISKQADPPSFVLNVPGNKYVLTVTNNGDADTSTGVPVVVSDTLPGGLVLDTAHSLPAGCTSSAQTISCSIASLASKASQSLEIWVIATDVNLIGKSVLNTATVTGGGDPACTSAMTELTLPKRCVNSVSTPVNAPKLRLSKDTGDGAGFSIGVKSSYVLTVTNVGTAATNGMITVYDLIPSALTVDESTLPAGCSLNGVQLTCESTTVLAVSPNAGSSKSFTIQVTPNVGSPATLTNSASVLGGGDPLCPSASNPDCVAKVTKTVATPTLTVTKADNGFSEVNGTGAAYILTVSNTSTSVDTVGTITVRDTLPAGVTATANTYGNWTCAVSGQDVSCTSSTSIAHQGHDTITLPVVVTTAAVAVGSTSATLTNNASVGGGGDPFNGGTPPAPGTACTALDAADPGHCATASTTVYTPAALAVSKTFDAIAATPTLGQYQATYTVTVTNTGGLPGSYTLTDTPGFAAGVVLNGWTVNSANGSVYAPLPVLSNGTTHQISATATSIAAGGTHSYVVVITFTANSSTAAASLTCSGTPGNGAYNAASIGSAAPAASACGNLPGLPNLTLAKSSNGPWSAGQTGAQYVLTVTNVGNAVTSGTTKVVDTLPTGVSAVNITSNGWTCTVSGQTVTCETTAALAVGTPSAITLPVTLSSTLVSSTGVVNVASVGGGGDPNNGGEPPVPGTCAAGDLHCASVTTPVGLKADLRITKVSAQGTQYVPEQPLNYTIEVFNDGPSSISGASVLDAVPTDVEVSQWTCVATGTGSCGANVTGTTNNVSLTGVALAMGEKLTITIQGTAARNATGDIVNKATVTPPAGVTCTTAPCEKESPPVTSTNAGTPALVIEKEATPTTFAVGQNGIYSLKVRNNGTNSTSGAITVTDRMPAGITITSIEPNSMWNCSGASGADLTCTTSDALLPNASAPVIIAHVAVANTVVTPAVNTASVTGGGTACTTQSPCSVTVQTNVDRPQLAVSKKLDGSFVVGQPTSYTITVENKGQAATLAGTITDTVPSGLTVGDLTNSGCSANGNVVTCNVSAGMLPGSSTSFTIAVTPLASADGTSQLNKAVANGDTGDSTCPSETHCTGQTDDPVTAPKLEMTKTASAGAFTVGQPASYTLTVTNNGTAATTGVITITDVVPAGLSIDSVTPTSATCAAVPTGSQTVTCTVSALAIKASASIVIGVTPKASADKQTMVNQAGVTGGGDPLCADGTATASLPTRCAPSISTPVNAPHLLLEKSTGMTEFSVGVPSTYVLKVTNVGTAATSGKITIVDTLPVSMTLGDLTSEPGCSATGTLVKQLTCESSASLAVNGSVTFTIPVTPTVAAAPSVTNNAQAYGGGDPLCPMDASCKSSITTVVNAPDLHIVKTDNGPWVVGQADAAYTLTVNNSSAIAASVGEILINVKDVMPLGIEPKWTGPLVSANWSCSYVGRSVTCQSINDLVIGANLSSSITLPVNVTTAALGGGLNADVTNHASVSGGGDPFNDGDAPDPGANCLSLDPNDPGHCAQKITRIFALADLVVSKSNPTFTATGVAGQYIAEYQIDVKNLGGSDGNYTLSDTPGFPADVVLNSWTARLSTSSSATALTAPVNGVATQISAANELLPVGATHSYVIALTFSMQAGVTQVACTGNAGNGAFNAASIVGTNAMNASGCAALPGVPSLGLVKTSNGPWTVDQPDAKYTLTVTNNGTASTNGSVMTVSDSMPAGLTATAGSSNGWTCAVAGQQVTCTNSSVLAAGASSVIELPVKVTSAAVGNPSNMASVGGGGDPYNGGNPPVPGSCAAGDLHCASVPTKVNALADPVVTKTNNQSSLVVGSTTTYTVTISNPGTTDATGISWTDTVVSGLKDVSIVGSTASSGSNAGTCAGLTCTGITVAAGGNVVYKVTATVSGKAGEKAENTASVTGGSCLASSPCTSTDSDPIVNEPQDAVAVPVDSRTMLVLLALAMAGMAYRQMQRARR